jgi:voltage-gated potassium channel
MKLLVSKNYLNTLKKNWFLVIILLMPAFRIFRLARLARILRVIRLLRLRSLVNHFKKNTRILIHNLEYGLAAFLIVVLISSFFMWQVEQKAGGAIQSFEGALWWSVITITTIGYGDIVPTSPVGKIIGGISAFVGVLIFMIITAKIASVFTQRRIESSQEKLLKRLIEQMGKSKKR